MSNPTRSGRSHQFLGTRNTITDFARVLLLLGTISIANQWLLSWFTESVRREIWQVAAYFSFFVVQVGLVGFFVGRRIPAIWSWIVFGWCLCLIDLLTFCMAVSYPHGWEASGPMLGSALVSGQVGAIIVWGVLGEQRWGIRLPIAGAIASGLLLLWRFITNSLTYHAGWFQLLSLQTVLLCAFCVVLRGRGCRLIRVKTVCEDEISAGAGKHWQFNLKEVFVQTTMLAVVMGILRATFSRASSSPGQPVVELLCEMALAALLAVAMWMALWTVFSERFWLARFVSTLAIIGLIGIVIAWSCNKLDEWMQRGSYYWHIDWFVWPKMWWIPWLYLATGFLIATLWIFRVKGYRLHRVRDLNNTALK